MTNESISLPSDEGLLDFDDSLFIIGEEEDLLADANGAIGSFLLETEQSATKKNTTLANLNNDVNSDSINDTQQGNRKNSIDASQNYGVGMMNAVHMEVQENAKIPTFLHPVDRSNSGSVNVPPRFQAKKTKSRSQKNRQSTRAIPKSKTAEEEEMMPDFLHGIDFEKDFKKDCGSSSSGSFNLTEMFLGIDDRPSAADAYKSAGIYGNSSKPLYQAKQALRSTGVSRSSVTIDSRIPEVIHTPALFASDKKSSKDSKSLTVKSGTQTRHHGFNYYPYGRHEMLPIPAAPVQSNQNIKHDIVASNNPIPVILPTKKGINHNLNTKDMSENQTQTAARNSTPIIKVKENLQTISHNADPSPTPALRAPGSTPINPLKVSPAIVSQKSDRKIASNLPYDPIQASTLPHQQSQVPPLNNAQSYYVNRSSTSNYPATTSYAQVPSQSNSSITSTNSIVTSKSILEATQKRNQFGFGGNHVVPSVPHPPPTRSMPTLPSSGAPLKTTAYRAKQSRPKIAAPVPPIVKELPVNKAAYERKKQRAKDSRIRLNEAIEKLSLSISVAGIESDRRKTTNPDFQDFTLKTMENCVKTSKDAKKWDRPSFIDTAATLIQQLHEQCEALEKEVHILKQESTPNKFQKLETHGEEITNDFKKRKLDNFGSNQNNTDYFYTIINYDTVMLSLTSFLDPLSLTRCVRVSKYWAAIEQFRCDQIWGNLCVQRFGTDNVSTWIQDITKSLRAGQRLNMLSIYRQMHEVNVPPPCDVGGNVSLGEGNMKGVSAWASMLERSNGETLRTVLTEPLYKMGNKKNSNEEPYSGKLEYNSLPVVELRIVIQNTGNGGMVAIPDQVLSVDAGTRRKGEEMLEITTDERLTKNLFNLDGSPLNESNGARRVGGCVCLRLFDSVVLVAHIYARGCSTTYKFKKKANFTKVLVSVNGITVPVLIPFVDADMNEANSEHMKENSPK